MEEVVIDASVVTKWFIMEEDREKALRIRDDYIDGKLILSAPSLMPFEVVNAVRYSRKDMDAERLSQISESLSLYGIKLHNLKEEYAKATIRAALDNGITIYDASYVALAEHLKTIMYTADVELVGNLIKKSKEYVRYMSEYV